MRIIIAMFIGLNIYNHCTMGQSPLDSLKAIYANQTDTLQLQTIRNICGYHYTAPDSLIKYANLGSELSDQINHTNYQAKFLMYKAIAHRAKNQSKQSIIFGRKAVQLFESNKNWVWASGMCHEMANYFQDMLMYDSAVFYCLKGVGFQKYMDTNPGTYQIMGNLAYSYELSQNVEQAILWNRRVSKLATENNDPFWAADADFNLGNVYDQLEKYDSALYFKHRAFTFFKKERDETYLTLLGNIGNSHLLSNSLDSALYYTKIFYDAVRSGEFNDMHVAIGHEIVRSSINLGAIYMKKNQFVLAKKFLNEGLEESLKTDYQEKTKEGYMWLYHVEKKLGNYQKALLHHEKFMDLQNLAVNEENNRNIQQLSIQYETERKEQEIAVLALQNQLKDSKITSANNRFYMAVGGSLLLVILAFALFSRYKHKQRVKLELEKAKNQKLGFKSLIEGEEKERKRIAQELHDGLGQLLSSARLNVSAMEDNVNEVVETQWKNSIKLIDDAVTEVRTISHNMMPNALISIGFEAALQEQIHIINHAGQVQIHADLPEDKIELPEAEAIALYRIIQEILNNALKYAEAKNIWLNISSDPNILISVKDDGKGFDTTLIQSSGGIGWRNIKSRVDILNGELIIQSEIGKGSEISLKMAV